MRRRETISVGVISDTHGVLRPQAVAALRDCAMIMHAGDIGKPDVISGLRVLAPTIAVRGNIDTGEWAKHLPMTERIEVGDVSLFMLHQISQLDFDPAAAATAAIVFGHSHRPSIETRDGVLFLNPGSAGPRRFRLPVTVARITVSGRRLDAKIVELQVS
jgi:putative phosphoesterase